MRAGRWLGACRASLRGRGSELARPAALQGLPCSLMLRQDPMPHGLSHDSSLCVMANSSTRTRRLRGFNSRVNVPEPESGRARRVLQSRPEALPGLGSSPPPTGWASHFTNLPGCGLYAQSRAGRRGQLPLQPSQASGSPFLGLLQPVTWPLAWSLWLTTPLGMEETPELPAR